VQARFVSLLWFIWLVSFNQKPNKPDEPNKPNEPDKTLLLTPPTVNRLHVACDGRFEVRSSGFEIPETSNRRPTRQSRSSRLSQASAVTAEALMNNDADG
jgi:hypothetical protein